jgi:hypothetical protein
MSFFTSLLLAVDGVLLTNNVGIILTQHAEHSHMSFLWARANDKQLGTHHFPPTGREDVLVLLVPVAVHNFPRMRLRQAQAPWLISTHVEERSANDTHLVFLDASILHETNVVVHVKVEERAAFPARLRHDQIVERIVLEGGASKLGC